MPTAEFINDPINYPATISIEDGRRRGTKFMRVYATSLEAAEQADGIPPIGTSFGGNHPELLLSGVSVRPESKGGDWYILSLRYRSLDDGQVIPIPGFKSVTTFRKESSSETVYYDLSDPPKPVGLGGQGVSKYLTAARISLTTFHEGIPDIFAYEQLSSPPTVNSDFLNFPNFFNKGVPLPVPAERLLYLLYEITNRDDYLAVEHTFLLRTNWNVLQPEEAADGSVGSDFEERRIYEFKPHAPLLSGI